MQQGAPTPNLVGGRGRGGNVVGKPMINNSSAMPPAMPGTMGIGLVDGMMGMGMPLMSPEMLGMAMGMGMPGMIGPPMMGMPPMPGMMPMAGVPQAVGQQQGMIRPPNLPFGGGGPKGGGPRSDTEYGGGGIPMRGRYGAIVPQGAPGNAGGGGNVPKSQQAHASNDYCQHFVDTGQRPQNFLRDTVNTDERYDNYPTIREMTHLKEAHISKHATPPYYLKADLRNLNLSVETFGTKFDVIIVDPPWEEYVRRAPGLLKDPEAWAWKEIMALEIENIADNPSFIFLWCGCAEGLEAGRHCLKKWGFRRCEDICWIKTNREQPGKKMSAVHQEPSSVLVHTKEHCLMGIKGSVKRGLDGHFIHANCDTDIIVGEEPPLGSTAKPEELYQIIERFCNGRRRLELFGEEHNIRDGWVTVGRSLPSSNFSPSVFASHFKYPDGTAYVENRAPNGKLLVGSPNLLPMDEAIEDLRPKSPPHGRK